jgi:hypothetical protein
MQYDYTIKAEISHIKLISKALDILKSIAKGEISRAASLLPENKKTHIEIIKEYPEFFDIRMNVARKQLLDLESYYFKSRQLNILQLGDFGSKLASIKQRFIDTAIIIKNKRLVYIPIQVTADDLLIINLACNLYWNILIYNFDTIVDIIKHKVDKEMLSEDLKEISYKSKGFLDRNYEFTIDNKCINRKAKWAYDICVTIDNIDKKDIIKNIGTLPKIKIIKNG